MATIIVKRLWLSAPIDSPREATMTSVEPRAFMPQPRASDSLHVSPLRAPPMNAPLNLPRLAIAMKPSERSSSDGASNTRRSAFSPARPKKTGMKRAVIRPRNWSSMWRLRIGDWPTRMPATNAPRTVWTPMACVVRAMIPITTRMVVMTGTSLTKLSLAHRIRKNTSRRPKVKLATRNSAVPKTLWASEAISTRPCDARPNVTAMTIQQMVSSMIAEVTIS